MKAHIHELAALVPMCAAINTNKLDKFTVLRLALQHIKSLLGSARPAAGAASLYKPAFVSDEELKQLMQYSGEGKSLLSFIPNTNFWPWKFWSVKHTVKVARKLNENNYDLRSHFFFKNIFVIIWRFLVSYVISVNERLSFCWTIWYFQINTYSYPDLKFTLFFTPLVLQLFYKLVEHSSKRLFNFEPI